MKTSTFRGSALRAPSLRVLPRWLLVGAAIAVMLIASTMVSSQPVALAQTDIRVVVTVHKVWERGCYGEDTFLGCVGGEDADFYSVISIADQRWESPIIDDQTSIQPEWQPPLKTTAPDSLVPIRIEMWDDDGGLRGDDDHVDLTAGDGQDLNLTLVVGRDPGGCRVGGNFPGGTARCGQRLSDGGNNDEEGGGIEFTVDVIYPTRVGRNAVLCTHTPLWPQPGQPVTINAVAMDIQTGTSPAGGFGAPTSYTLAPVAASKIEIWVNPNGAAANRTLAQQCLNPGAAAGCSANVNPVGATFQYGCWVEVGGTSVSSNFREVSAGAPAGANIVPVIYTQPKERAIDIVVYPDRNYANGWMDAQFLQDASAIVNGAVAEPEWLRRQDRVNVWVSQRAGNPTWPATGTGSTPVNYGSIPVLADGGGRDAFADGAGIIHRRTISDGVGGTFNTRDGASGGVFTANALIASAANIMRHELGHAVFGLMDEYCCDGGYSQQAQLPNVYSSQMNCTNDLADLDRITSELKWPAQGPCRSIPQATPGFVPPAPAPTPVLWWVSDPSTFQAGVATMQDLMSGNDFGMASDIRRFRWTFDQICPVGGC